MIKTFKEAVKYLEGYIPTPSKKHPGELGLKRMEYLMDLLGNPQLKYPTIHVGGTSGKGSTTTIIASILATKYKVGLHTSPHLVNITERIMIYGSCHSRVPDSASKSLHFVVLKASEATSGSPSLASPVYKINEISQRMFTYLLNKIIPVIKKVEKSELGAPSYFEIVTAMAFLYFHMQKVDFAVIEVGMGGKYDATNVINPLVAVITNVGLDHTEILGDTVEKIAEDKVGIIKRGVKVVTGVRQPSIKEIVKRKALSVKRKEEKNNLSLLGRDYEYKIKSMGEKGSVFDYFGKNTYRNLKLSLLGEHQVENAALATRAVELLNSSSSNKVFLGDAKQPHTRYLSYTSSSLSESLPPKLSQHSKPILGQTSKAPRKTYSSLDIKRGLKNAFIPGRLEIIRSNPLVILDGAHNPDKVKALVNSVKRIFPKKKITVIIAIKNDKNARNMLVRLLAISERVIFTKFQLTADIGLISSYDPQELLKVGRLIDQTKPMKIIAKPNQALNRAIKSAENGDLILITGSLYLVGEMKKNFKFQNPNFR